MLRLESLQKTARSLVKEVAMEIPGYCLSCNGDPRILQVPDHGHLPRRASDGEHGWPKREAYKLQMAELGRMGCSSS